MAEEDFVPGLEDMVFFEDDALADYQEEPTKGAGVDPTAIEIEEDNPPTDPTDDTTGDDEDIDPTTDLDTNDDDDDDDSDPIDDEDSDVDEDIDDDDSEDVDGEYTPYFNLLKDQGILMLGDEFEFDGTAEGIQEALAETRKNMQRQGALEIWNQLPKDYQLVLEHGLSGGTDINAVKEVISNQTDLDSLDIEDESTQENVVYNYLKSTTRYSDDRIQRTIARLRSSGDLEEEAESALGELKEIYKEEREQLVQKAQKEKEEQAARLQESYQNFTEVVDSMKLPEGRRNKLISSIWSTGEYGGYKDVSYFNYVDHLVKSNPEHLAQLAELYMDYDPKKGFNSDKIKRRAKTEANVDFKNRLDELGKTKSARKGSKNRKPKAKGKDVDILESIFSKK